MSKTIQQHLKFFYFDSKNFKKLSKYSINEPSIDSSTNVIPISSNRNKLKFQNLIKKKTRLLKNVGLLAPCSRNIKGKISNMNDLENEIDHILR